MRMKIGVYLHEGYDPHLGGGFSYSNTLIRAIDEYAFDDKLEIVYVTQNAKLAGIGLKRKVYVLPGFAAPSFSEKLDNKLGRYPVLNKWFKPHRYDSSALYRNYLNQQQIKLLYYPIADLMLMDEFPFIATYWDIGHCSSYPFPEFTYNGEYNRRENWYRNYLNRALLIFSESEAGKREVVKYLGINENKISVVPMFPAEFTTGNNADASFSKHNIAKGEYFLYPAQFWAHKNHYHLVQAFAAFLSGHSNKQFKLVFTGSDKGNAPYIKNLVQQLGIGNNVVFAGFVEDDFLSALYKHAAALVMPTFLGPTNMPLLEAARVLCPVICTNFEGHREMLADGALYIDPLSSDSIAAAMQQVVTAEVSNRLKQKLQQVNATSAFTLNNTLTALNKGFVLAHEIRNCWD